jgi:hypothetical protein
LHVTSHADRHSGQARKPSGSRKLNAFNADKPRRTPAKRTKQQNADDSAQLYKRPRTAVSKRRVKDAGDALTAGSTTASVQGDTASVGQDHAHHDSAMLDDNGGIIAEGESDHLSEQQHGTDYATGIVEEGDDDATAEDAQVTA